MQTTVYHVFPFAHPNTVQTSYDPNEAKRFLQNCFPFLLLSNPEASPDCRTEVGPSSGVLLLPLPKLAAHPTLVTPGHTLSRCFNDHFCWPHLIFSVIQTLQTAGGALPTCRFNQHLPQNVPVPPETDPSTRASTGWGGGGE